MCSIGFRILIMKTRALRDLWVSFRNPVGPTLEMLPFPSCSVFKFQNSRVILTLGKIRKQKITFVTGEAGIRSLSKTRGRGAPRNDSIAQTPQLPAWVQARPRPGSAERDFRSRGALGPGCCSGCSSRVLCVWEVAWWALLSCNPSDSFLVGRGGALA